MLNRKLAAILSLAVLAACENSGQSAGVLEPAAAFQPSLNVNASASSAADELSRAFALAMNEQDVRIQVRNAMRESLVNEHKVVLQEFVATKAGRRLVEAAARAAGRPVEAIEALVAQLPPMDFYAPFQEHRRAWRATADVVVGYTMDQDSPLFGAYAPTGRKQQFDAERGAPGQAVLIMHPAEPKSPRGNPQSGPGSVIEDPNDGQTGLMEGAGPLMMIGEGAAFCAPDTLICEAYPVEPIEPVGPESGGEEAPPAEPDNSGPTPTGPDYGVTVPSGTVLFRGFYSNIKDGIGAAELRFIIKNSSNVQIATKRWDGIQRHPEVFFARSATFPLGATITVREIDTWDSDNYGTDVLRNARYNQYSIGAIKGCANMYLPDYEICHLWGPTDPMIEHYVLPEWQTDIIW